MLILYVQTFGTYILTVLTASNGAQRCWQCFVVGSLMDAAMMRGPYTEAWLSQTHHASSLTSLGGSDVSGANLVFQ